MSVRPIVKTSQFDVFKLPHFLFYVTYLDIWTSTCGTDLALWVFIFKVLLHLGAGCDPFHYVLFVNVIYYFIFNSNMFIFNDLHILMN